MKYMICIPYSGSDIVRYHDYGDALLVKLCYEGIHLCRNLGIKSGNRFIQKKKLSCGTESSCKKDSLLLSSGKLSVASAGKIRYSHPFHIFGSKFLIRRSVKGLKS